MRAVRKLGQALLDGLSDGIWLGGLASGAVILLYVTYQFIVSIS